jgi:hypothetical protein
MSRVQGIGFQGYRVGRCEKLKRKSKCLATSNVTFLLKNKVVIKLKS